MNYDEFLQSWHAALRASRLPKMGFERGTIDLSSMDRHYEVGVEPLGGQQAEPFFTRAVLSFRWDVLQAARGRTCEEGVLTELLGRNHDELDTEQPVLRVDIKLGAHAPYGQPIPMPTKDRWAAWVKELMARLERVERLVPEEVVEEYDDGRLGILAWQGDPTATIHCGPDGDLRLHEVEIAAWLGINLPRKWDDPDRDPDPGPGAQLSKMFARVKASLYAFMEVLDNLVIPAKK